MVSFALEFSPFDGERLPYADYTGTDIQNVYYEAYVNMEVTTLRV